MKTPPGLATRAVHAGESPDPSTGSLIPPIHQTSVFAFESVERMADVLAGRVKGDVYSRYGNPTLRAHLTNSHIVCHPFIVGELALGNLRNRTEILVHLNRLPQLPVAAHGEVLALVERRRLFGAGIGWVDAHLLAAVLVAGASLWALDARLAHVARGLHIA